MYRLCMRNWICNYCLLLLPLRLIWPQNNIINYECSLCLPYHNNLYYFIRIHWWYDRFGLALQTNIPIFLYDPCHQSFPRLHSRPYALPSQLSCGGYSKYRILILFVHNFAGNLFHKYYKHLCGN
jgi:hypothetical protein